MGFVCLGGLFVCFIRVFGGFWFSFVFGLWFFVCLAVVLLVVGLSFCLLGFVLFVFPTFSFLFYRQKQAAT